MAADAGRHLFGTDGMRGVAGEPPLDPATLYRLGRALARLLEEHDIAHPRIAIGLDTRESCPWIAGCLAEGVRALGGVPVGAGVLPTPGLALLTREGRFHAGLMVSASHNPFADNGVKVFDATGSKLPDADEARLEVLLASEPGPSERSTADWARALEQDPQLVAAYLDFLDRCRDGMRLDGLTVVLDAANGAAYRVGPEAFRRAGATVVVLGADPDGRNINDGCGSLHPEKMAATVLERGAAFGFAFDGDADRCIAASAQGTILDGDFMLFYAGCALKRAGQLPHATVVSTVMSNIGLEKAFAREGIRMLRAPVGDRYVLQEMKAGGFALGGEQSGHVIFMHHAPTGDGVLTALLLACLAKHGAGEPDAIHASIPRYPQVLKNIKVREKPRIESHPALAAAVKSAEERLGGDGRVVVRYSGTEPKARVMIEGPDLATVEALVDELITVFRREVGA